jgi:hypothetical protein
MWPRTGPIERNTLRAGFQQDSDAATYDDMGRFVYMRMTQQL